MYKDDLEIVREELNKSDEAIKWYGRPIPKMITVNSVIAAIFGAIFIIFSLFWISTALNQMKFSFLHRQTFIEKIFPLFGVIFLVVGVLLFLSPLFLYKEAKDTVYAITDNRCIIIKLGKTKKVTSYAKESISLINRVEREDGSGDIIFSKEQYTRRDSDTDRTEISYRDIGFYHVPKVKEVERYLSEMINA